MAKLRNIFNTFKNKLFGTDTKVKQPTHSGTNYQPLKLVKFDPITAERKHPLHKYHFGTFSPIRRYK